MNAGLQWLNRYLNPAGLTADQAEEALVGAGFEIESREPLAGGDVKLDVALTSNRGDCLCHTGLAREIASKTGRRLVMPQWTDPAPSGEPITSVFSLDNQVPADCPHFTARVIRGVKVGPSPAWLVQALESVGQRTINNIVDVTNFLNFELGHPAHVFDLKKLAGAKLIIRWAREGEDLTTLDGKKRRLKSDELVVADGDRAQSLAGVIGGHDSEVDASTTDIVLEVATWSPTTVRRAARRHAVRTDASHRFERGVTPLLLDHASRRAAALIVELAGGKLCDGALARGAPLPRQYRVQFRPQRVRDLLGIHIPTDEMARIFQALEIDIEPIGRGGDAMLCTIPAFRGDLTREIDLVEEVARTKGLDAIPIAERLSVVVKPPQASERAKRELAGLLIGQGFYETVTFSFITPAHAKAFMPPSLMALGVDDERRAAEPTLRPSIIPSLLACRRSNQHGQVHVPGGIRFFETASVFAERNQGAAGAASSSASPTARAQLTFEQRRLALLADCPGEGRKRSITERQTGVRIVRGAVESAVRLLAGIKASLDFTPCGPDIAAYDPHAHAAILLNGARVGSIGIITEAVQKEFDLDGPVVAAEVELEPLLALYPPKARLTPLPEFPGIERDLSPVVPDSVTWAAVSGLIDKARLERLESWSFVGTFRDAKRLGPGKKALTLRLRFRDPARTLRADEIEPQVAGLVEQLKREVGAEMRAG
ncbi:MAG: phenylalanine--tRNA ligase subunit beta [Phycisphaerales bacterium]|nr:phenylalanine--tRNA ligase subunit beta [Phycisphaerales bacterium]